ncbi:hypothetical protein Hydth_0520 [Hydrogenobacter thermophilus TK-6]|uniref:Uncharacterized protein n=1 Tax=Hydrogenobacter thermophilus (strain DSM 6534 / IAM 12695 / TK-6) TaxID=608538 RepID=D3DGN4_HYDTT|nr:hypothetical protein [Hydrogenobacter thermophilus]ADO44920.1 hypothetical protein Hydth_0520 [Hydrogenobacter thermophilus TK-6]BAI68986.1 hypothetical protein HTH_0522 [Hydrogenobacter thermophilus TK-6]
MKEVKTIGRSMEALAVSLRENHDFLNFLRGHGVLAERILNPPYPFLMDWFRRYERVQELLAEARALKLSGWIKKRLKTLREETSYVELTNEQILELLFDFIDDLETVISAEVERC